MNVLQLAPNFDEALNALDVTWYQGRLVKRDALAQQKRADYQERAKYNQCQSDAETAV